MSVKYSILHSIHPDDHGSAQVGIFETTTERKEYSYQSKGNITLVDLPGLGSSKFPDIQTYCHNIKIRDCDAFLIMIAGRLTNNDISWAKKLLSIKKPFLFVRTKIDEDFRNAKEEVSFDEDAFKLQLREDLKRSLKENIEFPEDKIRDIIFLVNNNDPKQWYFPHLTLAISDLFGFHKRECWILSLQGLTEGILKKKVKELKGICDLKLYISF